MATSMDKKAANEGDKLKHPLLLEVLARCKGWDALTYAESHAGAGKYLAADQDADKPHIANLLKLVLAVKDKPTEEPAGGRYYHLLKEWWSDENRQGAYPGSVLQAARLLTSQKVKAEYRVTEADETTHKRLVEAVKDYSIEPKHKKFQNEIEWLTKKDSLVLLIDPLSVGEDFGDDRDKKLDDGGMDLPALSKLLTPCWEKKSAVILLWSGFGHNPPGKMPGGVKKGMVYGWLKCLCEQKCASFSCYHAKTYCTFIMGVGEGTEVTDQLLQLDWGKSWLSKTIHKGL